MDYFRRMGEMFEARRRARTGIEDQWFEAVPLLKEIDNELHDMILTDFLVFVEDADTYIPNPETIKNYLNKLIEIGNTASNILGELEGDLPYED